MHSSQQSAVANLHKELYAHAQDAFTISDDKVMNAGKVTFKTKGEEKPPSRVSRAGTNQSRKRAKGGAEEDDPNRQGGRMLKTNDIIDICERN